MLSSQGSHERSCSFFEDSYRNRRKVLDRVRFVLVGVLKKWRMLERAQHYINSYKSTSRINSPTIQPKRFYICSWLSSLEFARRRRSTFSVGDLAPPSPPKLAHRGEKKDSPWRLLWNRTNEIEKEKNKGSQRALILTIQGIRYRNDQSVSSYREEQ